MLNTKSALFGLLFVSVVQCIEGVCESGWTPHFGQCYKYTDDPVTNQAAVQACQQNNAILVTIKNQEQNDYVKSNIIGETWIGLHLEGSDWRWLDNTMLTYFNWNIGEPGDNETCARIRQDGLWFGIRCDNSYHYMCQKPETIESTTELITQTTKSSSTTTTLSTTTPSTTTQSTTITTLTTKSTTPSTISLTTLSTTALNPASLSSTMSQDLSTTNAASISAKDCNDKAGWIFGGVMAACLVVVSIGLIIYIITLRREVSALNKYRKVYHSFDNPAVNGHLISDLRPTPNTQDINGNAGQKVQNDSTNRNGQNKKMQELLTEYEMLQY